jgi:hypothetical protein
MAPAPPPAGGEPWDLRSVSGLRVRPGARLNADAAALALYMGAEVRAISKAPALSVTGTSGGDFVVSRRYASRAQALAFQYVLDRLRVLNVIDWSRSPREIHITVFKDAGALRPLLER